MKEEGYDVQVRLSNPSGVEACSHQPALRFPLPSSLGLASSTQCAVFDQLEVHHTPSTLTDRCAQHDGKCVTIFSAPNYCDQMGNKGAFIR